MRAKKIILPILILVGFIVLSVMLVAGLKKPPEKKDEPVKPLMVATDVVSKQDIHFQVVSQGTVKPKMNSMLVTEVNGRIIELADNFVAGGFFKKGDVILKVDPSDYQTAVKSAQANLARAEATLQEEKARAKVAENEWNSFMEGEAPELYLRKPQLARELANVRSAQASLETAERDLRRTVVRAPFDAMKKQKNAELGQFVNRGANVGSIYGTEVAEIRLPLSDVDNAYIDMPRPTNNHAPVDVTLVAVVAGKVQKWQGNIVRTEGVVDDKSRVTYAVVELKDPYGLNAIVDIEPLVFGRFVRAQIKGRFAPDIAIIPRNVLTREDQLLVVKDSKIEVRELNIARMDEDKVYVLDGLSVGEQYVTSSIPNPMNGMKVRTKADIEAEPVEQEDDQQQESLETIAQTKV